MKGERIEIRTPQEKLLVFVVVEADGKPMLEIKKSYKTDYIEIDWMIQLLSNFTQQNLTPQYTSCSD